MRCVFTLCLLGLCFGDRNPEYSLVQRCGREEDGAPVFTQLGIGRRCAALRIGRDMERQAVEQGRLSRLRQFRRADNHLFTRIVQHPYETTVATNIEFIFEEVIGQLPGLLHQLFEPLGVELLRRFDLRGLFHCSASGRNASSNEKGSL